MTTWKFTWQITRLYNSKNADYIPFSSNWNLPSISTLTKVVGDMGRKKPSTSVSRLWSFLSWAKISHSTQYSCLGMQSLQRITDCFSRQCWHCLISVYSAVNKHSTISGLKAAHFFLVWAMWIYHVFEEVRFEHWMSSVSANRSSTSWWRVSVLEKKV